MELLIALAAFPLIALGARWYCRAYREAREYREIDASWGPANRDRTHALHHELLQRGLRVKLKTVGLPDIGRILPQRLTSLRVHRDDYAEAIQIIRSLPKQP